MSLQFEDRNENLTAIMHDGKQVGIITKTPTGQFGYSLFGTPHQGPAKDADEAKDAVRRVLT